MANSDTAYSKLFGLKHKTISDFVTPLLSNATAILFAAVLRCFTVNSLPV